MRVGLSIKTKNKDKGEKQNDIDNVTINALEGLLWEYYDEKIDDNNSLLTKENIKEEKILQVEDVSSNEDI